MKVFKAYKYGASWCSQCKMQDKELKDNPLICELEVIDIEDLSEERTEALKLRSIPVIILESADCKDKEPLVFKEDKRWIGFTKSEVINQYIKANE